MGERIHTTFPNPSKARLSLSRRPRLLLEFLESVNVAGGSKVLGGGPNDMSAPLEISSDEKNTVGYDKAGG
ncbi:hypothetical protein, partial [Streptomyces sp. NPDC052015]|uniref:hypothetical protein n=1 Tax=Streptomyces sp. NPDC052015 TaxID=3154755 RepID=UPI0034274B5A